MLTLGRNERKTEDIVRDHFKQYKDSIILEEQISDNPKIKKILSTASKVGLGKGFPEFIIQLINNPDLLIIAECKADLTRHESKSRDHYKDYAVDGVLLYSSYLSRDFDVLSIAVSGQNQRELRVSHFLQLKGEKAIVEKFSNKLLSIDDYLKGYLESPEKFRQDYDKLLSFSRELNDKLHGHKIQESERSLLISCILIALENKAFQKSYKDYSKAEDLANILVDTAEIEFKNSGIQDKKLKIVISRFEFIKTDTSLSTKEGVLREIILDIDNNINKFIRTHEYFDVLGQLYIEFLRYANSEKGLGIVLTPPHITSFMAELAEVNKDSVIYDSCAGTGGFLVSAMSLMIKDAKDDQKKIKDIKNHQLIGVEYQANIFALICSNMFIHQDGKTNILKGSCFDEEIIEKVKGFKPTVGLLNPPYKSDKKNDTEELEFVLSNLECLEQGGKCVAIVPMQAALAQSGKILALKRNLLEQHTLEAVLSMPDELFFNSNVGVVSCVMVFTAKRPHPKNKKVYFGYYKNDGYVKRKTKGRIDLYQKFEKEIKEDWITSFINREEKAGFSVVRVVSANDEWCAEAYMETDYSSLNENFFINTITLYISSLISNKKITDVIYKPISEKELSLNTNSWKWFDSKELFDEISIAKSTDLNTLEESDSGVPYVGRSRENNGITAFIDNELSNLNSIINQKKCLTVAMVGDSTCYTFWQKQDFVASQNILILRSKMMNDFNALFFSNIIFLEKYRFSYGRTLSKSFFETIKIKLPATRKGQPDWQFMEDYIKSLPYSANI